MSPKSPARVSVLLKGTDLGLFKEFQHWRSCCNPAVLGIVEEHMHLPTAYEYKDFY